MLAKDDYKKALKLTLRERRLWVAGLLVALGLSDAWRIVFDWGPESVGEKAGAWVRGGGARGAVDLAVFTLVAMAVYCLLRAVGYAGEMILVHQVAQGKEETTPPVLESFTSARRRYPSLVATLLPWDALRMAVIYLPSLIIAAWQGWDPRLHHLGLYLLALLAWFAALLAVYIPAGIAVTLAARYTLLREHMAPEAWREGWMLFRGNAWKCLAIWLQALVGDIIFVAVAWPLSVLLPWAAGEIADLMPLAPVRWLLYVLVYMILAGCLVLGQNLVQCFKSSLWTITFLGLTEEETEEDLLYPKLDWFPTLPSDPPMPC